MKRIKLTKRSQFPSYARRFKELKGICIGGCVDPDNGFSKGHIAHAHSRPSKFQGWVCFSYRYHLRKLVLLHEIAHLIANKRKGIPWHGKKWKDALVKIGGTFKSFSYIYKDRIFTNLDYTYRNTKL